MSLYELLRLAGCALVIALVVFAIIFSIGAFRLSSDVDRRTGHDELDDDQWQ